MTPANSPDLPSLPLRVAELAQSRPTPVLLEPGAEGRAALAAVLGIPAVRKLRLEGHINPEGRGDWRFEGTLGATVVQECVVTLDPVTSRIDAPVLRRYLAEMPQYEEGSEQEMPEDDSIEPLGPVIEIGALLTEALALELPDFPRAPEAEPVKLAITEPGKAPMSDEEARPFAGLAGLRDKLAGNTDNEGGEGSEG